MQDDKLTENWDEFISRLITEAPRGDWGDWSDEAEKAGPYDDVEPVANQYDDIEEVIEH